MNVSINLTPLEIKLRQEQQRRRRMLLTIGGFTLVFLLGIYCALLAATLHMRAEINQLSEQRQAMESEIPALAPYARQQALVHQTESIIKQAVGEPLDWAGMLSDTGRYIPQNVWLTNFSAVCKPGNDAKQPAQGSGQAEPGTQQSPASVGEITIQGYATDHASVAKWLEDMCQVSGLSGITCQFSSEKSLDGEAAVYFEIKADIIQDVSEQNQASKEGGS